MKDHLIEAINLYRICYPDYKIEYIYYLSTKDNIVTFRIIGTKGNSEISDKIKVDL